MKFFDPVRLTAVLIFWSVGSAAVTTRADTCAIDATTSLLEELSQDEISVEFALLSHLRRDLASLALDSASVKPELFARRLRLTLSSFEQDHMPLDQALHLHARAGTLSRTTIPTTFASSFEARVGHPFSRTGLRALKQEISGALRDYLGKNACEHALRPVLTYRQGLEVAHAEVAERALELWAERFSRFDFFIGAPGVDPQTQKLGPSPNGLKIRSRTSVLPTAYRALAEGRPVVVGSREAGEEVGHAVAVCPSSVAGRVYVRDGDRLSMEKLSDAFARAVQIVVPMPR